MRYGLEKGELERSKGKGNLPLASLVLVGVVGAWLAWVLNAQSLGPSAGEGLVGPGEKSRLYYVLHGSALLAVLAAGTWAAVAGGYRRLRPLYRAAFWGLQITAATWALLSYGLGDYLSFRAFGATGPFVWISTVLLFAGMDRRIWPVLDRTVGWLALLTSVLALAAVATTYRELTGRFFSAPVYYMVLLMWFGGWTMLRPAASGALGHLWRFLPYVTFLLLTVITQTRSWLAMSVLLLVTFLFLNRREITGVKVFQAVALMALTLALLGYFLKEPLAASFAQLQERALADTRTGQYLEFFADVPVSDLLLGRGPNGTWNWNGRDYQFFDNALLWMAFIGGLPILVCYVTLVILPGLSCLGSHRAEIRSSAVLLLLWGIACTGFSTYSNPSLTPHAYLLSLLAGRCLAAISDRPARAGAKVLPAHH